MGKYWIPARAIIIEIAGKIFMITTDFRKGQKACV